MIEYRLNFIQTFNGFDVCYQRVLREPLVPCVGDVVHVIFAGGKVERLVVERREFLGAGAVTVYMARSAVTDVPPLSANWVEAYRVPL